MSIVDRLIAVSKRAYETAMSPKGQATMAGAQIAAGIAALSNIADELQELIDERNAEIERVVQTHEDLNRQLDEKRARLRALEDQTERAAETATEGWLQIGSAVWSANVHSAIRNGEFDPQVEARYAELHPAQPDEQCHDTYSAIDDADDGYDARVGA